MPCRSPEAKAKQLEYQRRYNATRKQRFGEEHVREQQRQKTARMMAKDLEGYRKRNRLKNMRLRGMSRGAAQKAHAAALRAVPRSLPDYVRDDVMAEILLAVAEAKIEIRDIAGSAKEFVKGYWREYSHMTTVSLDAPIPGMDGVSYIDRLVSPEGIFA